jgi:hypothetical protein
MALQALARFIAHFLAVMQGFVTSYFGVRGANHWPKKDGRWRWGRESPSSSNLPSFPYILFYHCPSYKPQPTIPHLYGHHNRTIKLRRDFLHHAFARFLSRHDFRKVWNGCYMGRHRSFIFRSRGAPPIRKGLVVIKQSRASGM